MGKDSSIQWTTHTFNPWRGCTKVSPGCTNCYAETMSKRNPKILGTWGPMGTRVVASESKWREPLAWDREAGKAGVRERVFCASLADVFEDWDDPMVDSQGKTVYAFPDGGWSGRDFTPMVAQPLTMDAVRTRIFQTIEDTPHLDWLLLTKRPERWRRCWPLVSVPGHVRQNEGDGKDWQRFPNLWMGTTCEDQARADERIPHLLRCPAAVRFLSVEPMLGPIDLSLMGTLPKDEFPGYQMVYDRLHWVIVGGESGSKARPFDLAWARSIRDQCKAAGVAFFMKQVGANPGTTNYPLGHAGLATHASWKPVDSHGGDWDEWPEDLRIREFPNATEVAR